MVSGPLVQSLIFFAALGVSGYFYTWLIYLPARQRRRAAAGIGPLVDFVAFRAPARQYVTGLQAGIYFASLFVSATLVVAGGALMLSSYASTSLANGLFTCGIGVVFGRGVAWMMFVRAARRADRGGVRSDPG
jgi:hypothetical protein